MDMRHKRLISIVSLLALIPLVGLPFAIAAIIIGVVNWKSGGRPPVATGLAGIFLTIIVLAGYNYYRDNFSGAVYADLRVRLDEQVFSNLIPQIELYKSIHGRYPKTLAELALDSPKGSAVFTEDAVEIQGKPAKHDFFYRQVGCSHYYLRSVGGDGTPFTPDDVVPAPSPIASGKLGLLTSRRGEIEAPCRAP